MTRVTPDHLRQTERYVLDAKSLLETSGGAWPERLTTLLEEHYGWAGSIRLLSSEAEQTARLERPGSAPLILKISSRPEGAASFRFQSAALSALHGGAGFAVPRVVPTREGRLTFEAGGVVGYVQSSVDGIQLSRADIGPGGLLAAGRALGALGKAMGGLVLPAQDRPVLWNIGCWPGLLQFLPSIADASTAELVRHAMEGYAAAALPLLPGLPWQVTHNDPSPHNMFVHAGRIAFIDFGDGGFAPRLQDLAVAASHFVLDASLPLGGAEALIAGYASVLPLSPLDANLLVALVRARQAALILVNSWRAGLFPAEAAYINKNVARARTGLMILAKLDPGQAEAAVRDAARQPAASEEQPNVD